MEGVPCASLVPERRRINHGGCILGHEPGDVAGRTAGHAGDERVGIASDRLVRAGRTRGRQQAYRHGHADRIASDLHVACRKRHGGRDNSLGVEQGDCADDSTRAGRDRDCRVKGDRATVRNRTRWAHPAAVDQEREERRLRGIDRAQDLAREQEVLLWADSGNGPVDIQVQRFGPVYSE